MHRRTFLGMIPAAAVAAQDDLWQLAKRRSNVHRFSTLFTAQDVRDRLSTEQGLAAAVDWCRKTAVTRVFVEEYRDRYRAERRLLENARDRFRREGIEVSGCITTTQMGKRSTGWNIMSCFTDRRTQENVKSVFEYAASLFDEIMIDDFWFTDCACPECDRARSAKQVDIGGQKFDVRGDTWDDYRGELLYQLSRLYVLGAARQVNPKVKIIIKYPQWYDHFHERGYDVARETQIFDRIWVGTETRDREHKGAMPYEAYFIMRWLGGIGGEKCGGGWYDPYDTHEATYLEQARQTVLAGARESMLFCYGSLQEKTGPDNIRALRAAIPELLEVSAEVRKREPAGVAAYKPANSRPGQDAFLFDSAGMLGIPFEPCHTFPEEAPAAFFAFHAFSDPNFEPKFSRYIASGRPVLVSDSLAKALKPDLMRNNVRILDPKRPAEMRAHVLPPLKTTLTGGDEIGYYLFTDGSWVLENFSSRDAVVTLNGERLQLAPRGWRYHWA